MRLVTQIWMTKPTIDVYSCTVPRNCVRLSVSPRPLNASAAMFNCCSIRPAPIAAKAITAAMICRCRLLISSRKPSAPPTSDSSPVDVTPASSMSPARRMIITTMPTQMKRSVALTSSRLLVPTCCDHEGEDRRPGDAAEAGAAADEAEDALGLARIVDLVGERPELADEEDPEDQAHQVEQRPTPIPRRSGTGTRTRPAARPAPLAPRGSPTCAAPDRPACCSPA